MLIRFLMEEWSIFPSRESGSPWRRPAASAPTGVCAAVVRRVYLAVGFVSSVACAVVDSGLLHQACGMLVLLSALMGAQPHRAMPWEERGRRGLGPSAASMIAHCHIERTCSLSVFGGGRVPIFNPDRSIRNTKIGRGRSPKISKKFPIFRSPLPQTRLMATV